MKRKALRQRQGRVVKVLKKAVLLLIFTFTLVLQPIAVYAEEKIDAITGGVGVGKGAGSYNAEVTTEQVLSDSATVIGVGGQQLEIEAGTGELSLVITDNQAELVLPIVVEGNNDIAVLNNPDSGMTIKQDADGETILEIVISDSDGVDALIITADINLQVSRPYNHEFNAENVTLSCVGTIETDDLAEEEPELATVAACWSVDLIELVEDASVSSIVGKQTTNIALTKFAEAAQAEKRAIVDVAYVLTVNKVNLTNEINLGTATITMEVGKDWVDQYGAENIKIIRYGQGDEETSQLLPTEHKGDYEKDGEMISIFVATSEQGLSIFGLASFIDIPTPPWQIILPIVGGSVAILGTVFFFILRMRRKREKRLTRQWPTGLRREDWKELD